MLLIINYSKSQESLILLARIVILVSIIYILTIKSHCLLYLSTGGKNDDSGGGNICRLLVAIPRVLPCHFVLSRCGQLRAHTRDILGYLLAGNE